MNASLPLLCALGRHKTEGLAQWNDGYYFARCRRCGSDLVRTAFSDWTLPRGFRVVWSAGPPRRGKAAMIADGARDEADEVFADRVRPTGAAGMSAPVEFPIRDVEPVEASEDNVTADETVPLASAQEDAAVNRVLPVDAVLRSLEDDPPEEASAFAFDERPANHAFDADVDGRVDEVVAAEPMHGFLFMSKEELGSTSSGPPAGWDPFPSSDGREEHEPVVEPAHAPGDVHADRLLREVTPATAAPKPLGLIPDFMDEAPPPAVLYDVNTGRIVGPSPTAQAAEPERPAWTEKLRERADMAAARGRALMQARRAVKGRRAPQAVWVEVSDEAPPADGSVLTSEASRRASVQPLSALALAERFAGVIAAFIFGGFVLAAALIGQRDDVPTVAVAQRGMFAVTTPPVKSAAVAPLPQRPPARRDAVPAPARGVGAGDDIAAGAGRDIAYVTASLLKCRAIPAEEGETVRRLSRGAAVQVLGAEPGWLSISHGDRQCWAAREFISTERPL